eukprot:scaffold131524_cov45-Prasinocladus_malaysianus.AAC.1
MLSARCLIRVGLPKFRQQSRRLACPQSEPESVAVTFLLQSTLYPRCANFAAWTPYPYFCHGMLLHSQESGDTAPTRVSLLFAIANDHVPPTPQGPKQALPKAIRASHAGTVDTPLASSVAWAEGTRGEQAAKAAATNHADKDVMQHRGGQQRALLTRWLSRRHLGRNAHFIPCRYPNLTAGGLLRGMDYFGTSVFAISGSLTALSSGMDIIGGVLVGSFSYSRAWRIAKSVRASYNKTYIHMLQVGIITAVGGGTARDIIVGQHPVFWLVETEYLAMAVVAATAAYLISPYGEE